MGGRKGYPLRNVVGDIRKIKKEKKELLEWVDEENPKKVIKTTGRIIAKSDKLLESFATSIKFIDSIKDEEKKLKEESTKERRKDISKKWANFRKKQGKKFDTITNRKIVDSINRSLEDKK